MMGPDTNINCVVVLLFPVKLEVTTGTTPQVGISTQKVGGTSLPQLWHDGPSVYQQ